MSQDCARTPAAAPKSASAVSTVADFAPTDPKQLTFAKGDVLTVVKTMGQWWLCTNAAGSKGLLPSNFVSDPSATGGDYLVVEGSGGGDAEA